MSEMSEEIINHYVDFMLYRCVDDNETGVRNFVVEHNGDEFKVLFCYDNAIDTFSVIVRRTKDGKMECNMFPIGYHSNIINWTRHAIYDM